MAKAGSAGSFTHRAVIFPANQTALAFCRSLGPRGVPVDALATDPASPAQYSRYARGLRCPDPKSAEVDFIDFLIVLAGKQQSPPLLFCSDDRSLLLFEKYRFLLEKFYLLSFPAWECVGKILLKDSLYLQGPDGISTPATIHLSSLEEVAKVTSLMDFPLLLKPTLRCLREGGEINSPPFEKVFGQKAVRVRNRAELARRFQELKERRFSVLAQEEIPGGVERLYTLAIYAGRDGRIKAAWTGRKLAQEPADFGDALVVEAEWRPELLSLGKRVVRATGLYGIADLEFKHDPRDGQYKLLDINPRPWAWIGFPTLCGVNLPYAAYCDLTGTEVPLFRQTANRGMRWVSPRGLLISLIRSLWKREPWGRTLKLLSHLKELRASSRFGANDFLVRMFLSPAYWWEFFRQAKRNMPTLRPQ
ncbi:MAG: ATP-grasp domain-containing protein [Deltaproteobacteria bacterium]|nr:ATP-grasp domain-containing protein [Deltaproteobacteria bacterium]